MLGDFFSFKHESFLQNCFSQFSFTVIDSVPCLGINSLLFSMCQAQQLVGYIHYIAKKYIFLRIYNTLFYFYIKFLKGWLEDSSFWMDKTQLCDYIMGGISSINIWIQRSTKEEFLQYWIRTLQIVFMFTKKAISWVVFFLSFQMFHLFQTHFPHFLYGQIDKYWSRPRT